MPSTPADAMGLVKSAIRCDDPVVFLMHKRMTGARAVLDDDAHAAVPIGEAAVRRLGGDVTLVAYGAMVGKCMAAAERLAEDGVEAEVIDLRTLFPIDYEAIISSVQKTGRLVVVTEEPPHGGIGADVAATIGQHAFEYLDAPIARVQAVDTPISHSPPSIDAVIPSAESVEAAVRGSLEAWPASG